MILKSKRPAIEKVDEPCFHCLNPISDSGASEAEINGEIHRFCCNGCRLVSEMIFQMGNENYYNIRGNTPTAPVTLSEEGNANLDSDYTYDEFVTGKNAFNREVFIQITNIHCSACVWLNEKVLLETDGIVSARISFATNRAHIVWDDTKLRLSRIFEIIRSIGYDPVLYAPWKKEGTFEKTTNDLLYRMGVAGFSFGNIMLFSIALYAGFFTGIEMSYKKLFHYASWLLATPAFLYSGVPFYRSALSGIRNKILSMDILLVSGISLAYFYSVYVTLTDRGEVYFDSVCMIYFFILIGKFLETKSKLNATRKLSILLSKLPEICTVVREGKETQVLSSKILEGDTVKVFAGERIAVDGILISGRANIDEAFLTGESIPIIKKKGDKIFAGSLAIDSVVSFYATTTVKDSTLSVLKKTIEEANSRKPAVERATEILAGYFTKIVLLGALGTFAYWYFSENSLEKAIIYSVSVLIVACPCALGLSVPAALVMNNLLNSEKGILIRNPDMIEPLSKITTVVFDKTGTITEGKLSVISDETGPLTGFGKSLIFNLVNESRHPVSRAISEYLKAERIHHPVIEKEIEEIAGFGTIMRCNSEGKKYDVRIGKKEFIFGNEHRSAEEIESTISYISINGEVKGFFVLQDTLRNDAIGEIQKLREMNLELRILSGDNFGSVRKIASEVGIETFYSDESPLEKLEKITDMQKTGKKVLVVGDGINDSACLAKADVGISLGAGADLAIDKSDILLLKNQISGIRNTILLARNTKRVIRENIAISLIYNSVMLPLAASGAMLPVICAGFMTLSSLTVVGNSLSLRLRAKS